MLDRFKEIGVRMIGTRCIGYDHIDIAHAKEIGITVTNITYEIDGVAEFTVMGMLMAVRRIGEVHARTLKGDFRLEGMLSRQLKDLTVGIVGAGKIGLAVMRDLSGFGCRVLYSNRSRKAVADKYGEYVPFDELLDRSDIVSIHLEYMRDTHHMFDSDTIGKMKDGSILVNTSRGGLVDTKAMIDALESGKLSSAVLDVVEGEFGRYYYDCSERDLSGEYIDILRKMDNVIFTHHMGFYYRKAVSDMVYNCLLSMKMFAEGKDIPHRLA
jgi:D-lactate dehydrogenase